MAKKGIFYPKRPCKCGCKFFLVKWGQTTKSIRTHPISSNKKEKVPDKYDWKNNSRISAFPEQVFVENTTEEIKCAECGAKKKIYGKITPSR